jgi:hypothetical protein
VADLYFDADVTPAFCLLLTDRGHDVLTTQAVGRIAAVDGEQLLTATERDRVLVTHNGKDFRTPCQAWPIWRRAWALDPAEHAGVIAIPQQTLLPYGQAAREIDRLVREHKRIWNGVWFFDVRIVGWVRQV